MSWVTPYEVQQEIEDTGRAIVVARFVHPWDAEAYVRMELGREVPTYGPRSPFMGPMAIIYLPTGKVRQPSKNSLDKVGSQR